MWIPHKFNWMLETGAVHINIDYTYHTFVYDTMWHKITRETLVSLKLLLNIIIIIMLFGRKLN